MTVICWDGETLAADRMMQAGGLKVRVRKIFKIRGHLVGTSGDIDTGMDLISWFKNGADPAAFPKADKDNGATMLVVCPSGRLLEYDKTANAVEIKEPFYAIGSGKQCACVAMACGKTAVEAVKITNRYDTQCGLGVTSLRLPNAT